MKYYTEQDVQDICCFIAGWAIGHYKRTGKGSSGETIRVLKNHFRSRDIADLLEKPVEK